MRLILQPSSLRNQVLTRKSSHEGTFDTRPLKRLQQRDGHPHEQANHNRTGTNIHKQHAVAQLSEQRINPRTASHFRQESHRQRINACVALKRRDRALQLTHTHRQGTLLSPETVDKDSGSAHDHTDAQSEDGDDDIDPGRGKARPSNSHHLNDRIAIRDARRVLS